MWQTLAKQKNQFLHTTLVNVNPIAINRSMLTALEKPIIHTLDQIVPFQQPASLQPGSFGLNVDKTRIPLAYGRWGVPQLIQEINSPDEIQRLTSLLSLSDELHDPEKFMHAMRLLVVKRIDDCLDRLLKNNEKKEPDINRDKAIDYIYLNLYLISIKMDGALAILNEERLIGNLYNLITYTSLLAAEKTLRVLYNMSSHPKVAEDMLARHHLSRIKDYLEFIQHCPLFYDMISCLIERSPKLGIEMKYFEFLFPKLIIEDAVQLNVLKTVSVLTGCVESQKLCENHDIFSIMLNILLQDRLENNFYKYAAIVLHNSALSIKSRIMCNNLKQLPLILIYRAHTKDNDDLQLACLQALRQITEFPAVKNFVRKNCKKKIKYLYCSAKENQIKRDELLNRLRKKCYPATIRPALNYDEKKFFERRKEIRNRQKHNFVYRYEVPLNRSGDEFSSEEDFDDIPS